MTFMATSSLKSLILFMIIRSSSLFYLKTEKDVHHTKVCDILGQPTRIWYTANRTSVGSGFASRADLTVAVHTKTAQILINPQNDEEKLLKDYFLTKKFPYDDMFLDNKEGINYYIAYTKTSPQKWRRILRQVIAWMLEHKYLETDTRIFAKFASTKKDRFLQRVNYRQFPIPVLKQFHPLVEDECRKSLLHCLKFVHENAYAHAQRFNRYLNMDKDYFMYYIKTFAARKGHTQNIQLRKEALQWARTKFCTENDGKTFTWSDLGWTWSSVQNYEPFLSHQDLFQFRATASYFLCNYTLTERRQFAQYWQNYRNTNFITIHPRHMRDTIDQHYVKCLYGPKEHVPHIPIKLYDSRQLMFTLASVDGFRCNRAGPCQIPVPGRTAEKWMDDFAFNDFSCALLAFCPDPCCGAYRNPVEDPSDIDNCAKPHPDFPCRDGGETDECGYDVKKNDNFHDLIQNRMNLSCGCKDNGKEWNPLLGVCIDIDECIKENPCNKEMEVCINRLDGQKPLCICDFGSLRMAGTNQCILDPTNVYIHRNGSVSTAHGPVSGNETVQLSDKEAMKLAVVNIERFFTQEAARLVSPRALLCTTVFITTFSYRNSPVNVAA